MKKVLEDLACNKSELSILFTDDTHITGLNRRYLGRDAPTNVLAFSMSSDSTSDPDSGMLGDVVISVDTAIRESDETGEPLNETIYRLLIHGILHLLNYDHERSSADEQIMAMEENRLLSLIKEE
ncbi:rRNA maturation RNase YbeY [Thermodesulfobacteriota bacterium]